MTGKGIGFIAALSFCLLVSANAAHSVGMHQPWSDLLGNHVDSGAVDYQGFKTDENALDDYLALLDSTDPATLSIEDQLAFYINVYNAYTVKLILDHFSDGKPPSSIKKIGGLFSSPWKMAFVKAGGKLYTLDEIEHEIIRPRFKEPRIHFAVNCASKSCPPLISTAYEGVKIDEQLEKSTRDFLADPAYNNLDGSTLFVSSIFKWYGEDFQDDPAAFFLAHSEGDLRQKLLGLGGDVRVRFLDYDWSLNDMDE